MRRGRAVTPPASSGLIERPRVYGRVAKRSHARAPPPCTRGCAALRAPAGRVDKIDGLSRGLTMSAPGRLAPPAPRARRASRWWLDVLGIAWLLWLYDAISNLAPLRLHQALANGAGVL